MGLDVGFYVKGNSEPIAYLCNHHEFFEMLCKQPYNSLDDGTSDFWVNSDMLDGVEQLIMKKPLIGKLRRLSKLETWAVMSMGDEGYSWSTLKPLYLQLIGKVEGCDRRERAYCLLLLRLKLHNESCGLDACDRRFLHAEWLPHRLTHPRNGTRERSVRMLRGRSGTGAGNQIAARTSVRVKSSPAKRRGTPNRVASS